MAAPIIAKVSGSRRITNLSKSARSMNGMNGNSVLPSEARDPKSRRIIVYRLHRSPQISRQMKKQTPPFKNLCKSAKSVDENRVLPSGARDLKSRRIIVHRLHRFSQIGRQIKKQ